MTANNRHSSDGSAGRSTGDAAVRGALLVGVAVIIGALLLWRGHDDDGGTTAQNTVNTTTTAAPAVTSAVSGATGGTGKTGTSGTTGVTGSSAATGASGTTALRKPAEVKVLVANGSGTATGASAVTAKLQPKGYAMLPAADASAANIAVSRVYYRDGYAEEAKQVARDAGVAEPVEGVLERMPDNLTLKTAASTATAKTANIVLILGLDKKIPQP